MGATKIEFRMRMLIMTAITVLGFWAPWIEFWGIGRRETLWAWLAFGLGRAGAVPIAVAAPLVLLAGALMAAVGAVLRVWGAAWLGYATVHHKQMQGSAMLTDGPYRSMRNPLYLGGWCMMAAMSLLMPPTGALFAIPLLTLFYLRLILGEEKFLAGQLGEPYREYLRAVPRIFPRLRTLLTQIGDRPADRKPQWLHALITEINPIGVFVALAFFSWSYNNWLMIRAIIVSFGISIVVRALTPVAKEEAGTAE
jgi:protein-S-isoprenylcysteine O-methyltransferase Ste14